MVFGQVLVVLGDIVLGKSEPYFPKSGPTAPGSSFFVASSPSSLWMYYFVEVHLEGSLGLNG